MLRGATDTGVTDGPLLFGAGKGGGAFGKDGASDSPTIPLTGDALGDVTGSS